MQVKRPTPIATYQAPAAQMIEQGLSAPIARPVATPIVAAQASSEPPATFDSAAIGVGAGTILECGLALTRVSDIPTVRAVAKTIDFRLNLRFMVDSPLCNLSWPDGAGCEINVNALTRGTTPGRRPGSRPTMLLKKTL